MHARRFACMLLGMWLAGSFLMTWLTADSFNAAPRMLATHSAEFSIRLKSMGQEEARMMLAYPVRQQVGWWMEEWSDFEIALGAFFFVFLLLGTREGKLALGLTLIPIAVAIFQRVFMTPQLLYLGGIMDFVSPNMVVAERGQLGAVRLGFVLVEAFKQFSGIVLAFILIGRQHRRSGLTREEVDAIDKADDRHVNR
jgi:hypothetical protein